MTRPAAKGWCPGAYQPMMSGDGLVVRVRPIMARLTADQSLGLCDLAARFGSGLIDLTSRANLQIRGISEADHERLLQELNALELLPDDPSLEARRNILVSPFWKAGDVTDRLAGELYAKLAELPALPAKFGFAIDTGTERLLANNSADIRIEKTKSGLILRADDSANGRLVQESDAISKAFELAEWFVETGGTLSRRMTAHLNSNILPSEWTTSPAPTNSTEVSVGPSDLGAIYGAPFGQIEAAQLANLVKTSGCRALRVTPWRLFITEDAAPVPTDAFVTEPNDPLLNISACTGSPLCSSATVETRALAKRLATKSGEKLHFSGCSKGCAYPHVSDLTFVGNATRFDLVKNGLPWDEPCLTGLTEKDLLDRIGDF